MVDMVGVAKVESQESARFRDIDQAKGIMFGLAIGDALGAPAEYLTLNQIRTNFGTHGITDLPEFAYFTDDTQMNIAITEALIKAGCRNLEEIMAAVRQELITWLQSTENTRAPCYTSMSGIFNMLNGVHWRRSGDCASKGRGAAMRIAPIGYLYQNNPEKLKEVAHAVGACTHRHPAAEAACIGAAYLIKLALDRIPPEEMIPKVLDFTAGISCEFERALMKVEKCMKWCDEGKAISYLGQGLSVEEIVALAAYFFLKNPDDYEKTVVSAANTEGDSDSIACIAGAISGAYLGIGTIRDDWRTKIEKSQYLEMLARRLAESKTAGE